MCWEGKTIHCTRKLLWLHYEPKNRLIFIFVLFRGLELAVLRLSLGFWSKKYFFPCYSVVSFWYWRSEILRIVFCVCFSVSILFYYYEIIWDLFLNYCYMSVCSTCEYYYVSWWNIFYSYPVRSESFYCKVFSMTRSSYRIAYFFCVCFCPIYALISVVTIEIDSFSEVFRESIEHFLV